MQEIESLKKTIKSMHENILSQKQTFDVLVFHCRELETRLLNIRQQTIEECAKVCDENSNLLQKLAAAADFRSDERRLLKRKRCYDHAAAEIRKLKGK